MLQRYFLIPLILASGLMIGCGGGVKAQGTPGPTPATLAVATNPLAFGSVAVGGNKTSSLAISNSASSSQSIAVSQISITGAGFSLSAPPAMPLVLAAGQSATLSIKFSPTSAGSKSSTLSIMSDAADPSTTVTLSGDGLAAGQLAVSPSTMNFGSVAVGSSTALNGTLTASSSTITVSSAGWNGQGYSVSGITFPKTVAAGQSVSFTVTFTPQAGGTSSGSISFVSNASNSPNTQALTGTGTQAVQHTVGLSWDSSTSPVMGYNVYRGTHSGGPYAKLTPSPQAGTNYDDDTVQSGLTYYYVATSVDSNSMESTYSNQTTAAIPTP